MKHLEKTSIDDFNIEEARGWVLDRSNLIEKYLNNIILNYIEVPEHKRVFSDNMLLGSSIISFGSKIKVLQNIIDSQKLIDNLRKLLSIRNGFAHAIVGSKIELMPNEKTKEVIIKNVEVVINVTNSNGVIKTKNYKEYLKEFFELNKSIKEQLQKLKDEGKI